MKKLIAISVVFALLTGAAFAQVSIGVEAKAGATLVWGETNEVYGYEVEKAAQERAIAEGTVYRPSSIEAPLASAGYLDGADEDFQWGAAVTFSYETDGSEAGASFKIDKDDLFDAINAWWFVVPQLKLGFGESADFGRGDATPFHYEEGSGNWFAISIIPMDMFTLNISILDKNGGFYKTRTTTTTGTGEGYWDFITPGTPSDGMVWVDGDDTTTTSGGDAYTGSAAYMYADTFVIQAIVNIPGDLGQLAFTFDNQYYHEDGFAKSGPDFRGMGFFVDYSVADLMGFGVGIDFGFHYLNGHKEYNSLPGTYPIGEGVKPWDQTGDKYSKWGVGFGFSYSIMGIDLGLSLDMSQETIGLTLAEKNPKMYGMVMDLGFSVGYTLDLGMFDLALAASLDLKNLTGTDYYYTKGSDGIAAAKKAASSGEPIDPADVAKGYMALEYEFDISLIKKIGGFTFTGGFNLFGDNIEREAYVSPHATETPAETQFNDSRIRYKVPILFSYSW